MSKKIKTLVQKYEKDMQFENRFDELKHKLDLIPDAEIKSEVYTIKKKVMPAYAMMIVLLMLITGIIGLQFGLNTDFVNGQENINSVDAKLMDILDIYEREAIHTVVINSELMVHLYVGLDGMDKKIVVRLVSRQPSVTMAGTINEIEVTHTNSNFYVYGDANYEIVSINIEFMKDGLVIGTLNTSIDTTSYFDYLGF